jgi:hypothetical protein
MPETSNTALWQAELEVVVLGGEPASGGRYVTVGPAS